MEDKYYVSSEWLLKSLSVSGLTREKFAPLVNTTRQTFAKWVNQGGTSYKNYVHIKEYLGELTPKVDNMEGFIVEEEAGPYKEDSSNLIKVVVDGKDQSEVLDILKRIESKLDQVIEREADETLKKSHLFKKK